jgi:CRP-like cAMP-binding protein
MSTIVPHQILTQGELGQIQDPSLLKDLLWESELLDLPPGHILFQEGEASDGSLYLILSGGLQVSFVGPDGVTDTKEKGVGHFCGESALVTLNHVRTATVEVSPEGVKLMRWPHAAALLDRPAMQPLRKLLGKIAGIHWVETANRTGR